MLVNAFTFRRKDFEMYCLNKIRVAVGNEIGRDFFPFQYRME